MVLPTVSAIGVFLLGQAQLSSKRSVLAKDKT
jgi:hypothetical protein